MNLGLGDFASLARTTIWALSIAGTGVFAIDICSLAAGWTSVVGMVAVFFAGIQLCTAVCRADFILVKIPLSCFHRASLECTYGHLGGGVTGEIMEENGTALISLFF